jgi:hypothetical protein
MGVRVSPASRAAGVYFTAAACLGLLCLVLVNSCTKSESVAIERLDQALFSTKSPEAVQAFLAKNRAIAALYFDTPEAATDTALVAELSARLRNPELNRLYAQTQTEFGDAAALRADLGEAFTNIRRDFPNFDPPRVVTLLTGFMGPDLLVTDSLVVIGLDYFAGPKATYRPTGEEFPAYVLRRYQQAYIVPAIVRQIANRYNAQDRNDQTLLADMVYNGKSLVFTRTVLPNTPDSLIIGYSDRQLTETFNAQDLVWAHFIDNQLLYNTSGDIKMRYMGERPFTAEIGNRCPGRIGEWLGWRIVSRYFDKNRESLPDLMKSSNARQLFEQSGYKGQKDDE